MTCDEMRAKELPSSFYMSTPTLQAKLHMEKMVYHTAHVHTPKVLNTKQVVFFNYSSFHLCQF